MKFFAKENINEKNLSEALIRMTEQINTVGGYFTFDFKIDDDGWVAKCREFDGIVTGGTNKNPSQEEIGQSLIDAVKTAFHIPISSLEVQDVGLQKFPKIKVVREFQMV